MLWQLVWSMKNEIEQLRKAVMNDSPVQEPQTEEMPKVTSLIKFPDTDLLHADTDNTPDISPLDNAERRTIAEALARNNGDKKRTAAELNISLRTLYRKIQEFHIE
jgi:transcriptional regulator with PAS, ATPase and Fis domain